jgi:hypothetical protein
MTFPILVDRHTLGGRSKSREVYVDRRLVYNGGLHGLQLDLSKGKLQRKSLFLKAIRP